MMLAWARARGIAILLALIARGASAQATVTGRVTDREGAPLGGVVVEIRDLPSYRAATRADGVYTIELPTRVAGDGALTVITRAEGWSTAVRILAAGTGRREVDFVLEADPLGRDRVVSTGQATPTPVNRLTTVIGSVSHLELDEMPAVTALGGLQGKIAGVRVLQPSGDPASAPRIRLRGATATSGLEDPLIIIDGTISRGELADVSAEDIDRIEVAKGPAASAIYGSEAAAGVVQIFTRRGADVPEGKLVVTLRNEVGRSDVSRRLPVAGAHAYQLTTGTGGQIDFLRDAGGNRIPEPDRVADNPYPRVFDHQSELFPGGLFYTNHLAVAGRRRSTSFRASLQNSHSEGVLFALPGFRRQNLRLNADQRLGRRVDLGLSGFYGHSRDADAAQGTGSPFFALRFLDPSVDLRSPNPDGTPYLAKLPDNPVNASNPLYALANIKRDTERSRLIGGAVLRWRPLEWLAAEANYNLDHDQEDFTQVVPAGFLSSQGQPLGGNRLTTSSTGRFRNSGLTATAARRWNALTGTARVGITSEHRTLRESSVASSFGPSGPESESGLSTEIHSHAAYAATMLELADRYTVDLALRQDDLSFLAPEVRKNWYYRVGAAWRANQDLKIRGLDELRLHAAYGTAGLRPDLSLEAFAFTPIGSGIDALRPSHSGELELGANLQGRGGRFTLEYAYARKKTTDQIVSVFLATPVGFIQTVQNRGALEASTHELTLGYQVLRGHDVGWVLRLTGDRTRQTVTDYPLPEMLQGFGQQPAVFFLGQGVQLGAMYGNRFVRSIGELFDDPAKAAQRGAGQLFDPANFVVNEEGYVVSRASYRCGENLINRETGAACSTPERPITYVTCRRFNPDQSCAITTNVVPIGGATPDFRVGIHSSLRYKHLDVTALVDWNQGGNIYNGGRQWSFLGSNDPIVDQRGKPDVARKSQLYYFAFYNSLNPHLFFVESGTYVKIREIALTYTLEPAQLRRIGLGGLAGVRLGILGRNLFTFTKYSGEDPEVSSIDGDPFQRRIDWFTYPHFRTITGLVEIGF
jgi:outer membrane receptor protein involved in Fe transport